MDPAAGASRSGSWSRRRAIVVLLFSGLAFSTIPGAAELRRPTEAPAAIEVRAEAITAFDKRDPARKQFGQLEFRGGLVLTSTYKEFGGLSALRVDPDGARFISLSDRGYWLTGRIVYQGTQPAGITDAQMAPMLGPDGRPLKARGWYDTESLAADDGTLYVGIERVNRIVRFDYGSNGLLARGQPIDVPAALRRLPNNKGIEALVFVPRNLPLGGTLVAISERGLDANGNLVAFLIGGPSPGQFAVKRSDDFDVSDAALLPGGDILLLERKFSWTAGLFIRIRRIRLADIQPGALVDGSSLFDADFGYQIDNMEGLGVHRAAGGEIVLTLISDDNFSPIQRTLLLQFTLKGP